MSGIDVSAHGAMPSAAQSSLEILRKVLPGNSKKERDKVDPLAQFREMTGFGEGGDGRTALGATTMQSALAAMNMTTSGMSTAKDAIDAMGVITEKDYPALAALKLSGRALEKIAEYFDVPAQNIQIHVMRALAKVRQGEITPDKELMREEGAKEAKEDNARFVNDMTDALQSSEELSRAMSAALEALAAVTGTADTTSNAVAAASANVDGELVAAVLTAGTVAV